VKISNRFTALENMDENVHVNRVSEHIRDNIKIPVKQSPAITSYSSKNHAVTKNIKNYYIQGSGLNCSGCRIKAK
jgi:hypothetical protein